MRYLALDIGAKRIGVALCDRLEITVTPAPIVAAGVAAPAAVAALVRAEGVEGLVVGMPWQPDGGEGDACALVRAFLAHLQPLLPAGLPVHFWDESFTSQRAAAHVRAMGKGRKARRAPQDSLAASLLLQEFLAAPRRPPPAAPVGRS